MPGNPDVNPAVQKMPEIQTAAARFQINNAKLYIPVVTLSIYLKVLENRKQGFKKTISWNKHRSEIATETKK